MNRRLNKQKALLVEEVKKKSNKYEELEQLRPLAGIYRVIKIMAVERRLDSLLEVITRETRTILDCDRCSVFILDKSKSELWTQVAQGLEKQKTIRVPLSAESIVSECARKGTNINIADAYKDKRFTAVFDQVTGYRTKSILCVPMLNRHRDVIGVFQVLNKRNGSFSDNDEEWLLALNTVAAGLIEQAQAYQEIEHFVDCTLETLAQTIDKRDPLTAGHSARVTKYSLLLAEALNIPKADMPVLRYAAMMHDYGKIGVPEAILWKNGRLTPEEFDCVKQHARFTHDLLINLPFKGRMEAVPFIASCHHEKLDGTGYYRGLKKDEIPYLARIMAVADVFDALTSERHYRNRMPIDKVRQIMIEGRGNHFEPKYVDVFFKLPCREILSIMESERNQAIPPQVGLFKNISWQRLIDFAEGAKAKRTEEGLKDVFHSMYTAGLPAGYQALD